MSTSERLRWRVPATFIVAAATIAVLFLITRTAGELKPTSSESKSTSQTTTSELALGPLDASSSDSPSPLHRVVAVTPHGIESTSSVAGSNEADRCDARLIVRCIAKFGGRPLERVRIYAQEIPEPEYTTGEYIEVERQVGGLRAWPITGPDGEVELDLPSDVGIHLHAIPEKWDAQNIEVDVPALAHDERRTLVLEMRVGNELRFHGVVLAHDSREPIRQAKVRLVTFGARLADGETSTIGETTTDRDGTFDVSTTSWTTPFARIDAVGFVTRAVEFPKDRNIKLADQVIPLERGAAIDATVTGPRGTPLANIDVEALGWISKLIESKPDPERQSYGNDFIGWSAKTDADGRCKLGDLPTQAPLRIVLRHEGRVLFDDWLETKLEVTESRPMQFHIGGACTVSGTLRDQNKRPIGACELWCVRAEDNRPRYLQSHQRKSVEAKAKTDSSGKFELANVPGGRWWIGPAPAIEGVETSAAHDAAPFATIVVVSPDASRMQIEIAVSRGLYIDGRVVGDAEDPEPFTVSASGVEDDSRIETDAKLDGSFRLGPMMAGEYELTAGKWIWDGGTKPVVATAGDHDVILKLRPAGWITGKVVDASGNGARALVNCSFAKNSRERVVHEITTEADGSFQSQGIEAGTYNLSARTDDGRVASMRGLEVRARENLSDLRLTLESGAKLRLRFEGGDDEWGNCLIRCGETYVTTRNLHRGDTAVDVVPKGKLRLELELGDGDRMLVRDVEMAAEEEREVVFAIDS